MWCKDYVMTAKQDAVINELNTKVERLIKLYISSLDKNREMDSEMKELRIQIERMKSENMKLHEEIKGGCRYLDRRRKFRGQK